MNLKTQTNAKNLMNQILNVNIIVTIIKNEKKTNL